MSGLVCPTCGAPVHRAAAAASAAAPDAVARDRLPRLRWRLFSILFDAGGAWVDILALATAFYRRPPSHHDLRTARVHIYHLRRDLAASRWRIESRRGSGLGYRLVATAAAGEAAP